MPLIAMTIPCPARLAATIALAAGLVGLSGGCWCEASSSSSGAVERATVAEAREVAPQEIEAPALPDPVVATIGDLEIHRGEVERELERTMRLRAQVGRPPNERWREARRRKILYDIIERHLLRQAMTEKGLELSEATINERLDARVLEKFQTQAAFEQYLEKIGMSKAEYSSMIVDELAVEALVEDPAALQVTEQEIRAYYTEHSASFEAHSRVQLAVIVLKHRGDATEEERGALRERARTLSNQAQRAPDFAALARTHSEGPTASQGGALGWVYATNLDEAVAAKAFRLPVGAVSEPIETRLGVQIIKVIDRRPEGVREYDEVKESIERQLIGNKIREARAALLLDLKRRSAITLHDDALNDPLEAP